MSYIGKIPATGNFVKLDAISVVNGQAAYTMQSGSSNFTNYDNVNQFIVSLNGVIQAPTDSFTVSGSTITFASALSTGDVINFILVLGDVLSIGTPSDNTVSTAKIQNTAVNADKLATDAVQTAKIQNDAVTKDKVNFISDATAGVEVKGDGGSNDGYIQLNCSQNSHGIKLSSPNHAAGQSYTLTFPATAPATDKFLKTDNSGNLSFADAGGGQWTHLLTTTASSSSSIAFSSTYITTTYLDYQIVISGIKGSNDGFTPQIEMSIDNGSSYEVSYRSARHAYRSDGNNINYGTNSVSKIYIAGNDAVGNSTGEAFASVMTIFDPLKQSGTTDAQTIIIAQSGYSNTSNDFITATIAGCTNTETAINNIKFSLDTGNITSGKVSLYGRKLS